MYIKKSLFFILALMLPVVYSGCSKARSPLPVNLVATQLKSFPNSGVECRVALGEYLIIENTISRYKAFTINKDFTSSIPGSMGLPFEFTIYKCDLVPIECVSEGVLYCAPRGKFSASHSMLGTVVNGNDQIGIVVNHEGDPIKWFVDNSSWNGMRRGETYWDREITKEEKQGIKMVQVEEFEKSLPYRFIQLLKIDWPIIKIKYSENWDGSQDSIEIEVKADKKYIKIKQFELEIEKLTDSEINVTRIKQW